MQKFNLLFLFLACLLLNCSKQDIIDQPSKNLAEWLAKAVEDREPLESLDFSKAPLSKSEAIDAQQLISEDRQAFVQETYGDQWENRALNLGGFKMPFFYQTFGTKPADGRSLFISLHGGGGVPANVNDQQYSNQQNLYNQAMSSLEGIYLAPRAPTNTWNLWHQSHIDELFNLLIQLAVINEDVNPNKVYLLGYSAGGDGVYQLAPRMADRWAAAAMMAGHPNDASPLGLSNTPFTIHMGAEDAAFDRNKKAAEWKGLLAGLAQANSGTYIHDVQIHEGQGHWMNLKDAVALPWMANYQRKPLPQRVVWKQSSTPHESFYWLAVPSDQIENGGEIIAEYDRLNNEIDILANYSSRLHLQLNDEMLDLDKPIKIKYQGTLIHEGTYQRTILNIYNSVLHKGDPHFTFPVLVTVLDNAQVE